MRYKVHRLDIKLDKELKKLEEFLEGKWFRFFQMSGPPFKAWELQQKSISLLLLREFGRDTLNKKAL